MIFTITTIETSKYQAIAEFGNMYVVHFLEEHNIEKGLTTCVECLVDHIPSNDELNVIKEEYYKSKESGVIKSKCHALTRKIKNTRALIAAIERIIAKYGVTEEDVQMANERIDIRNQIDELGKVIQTTTGNGSWQDAFKTWKEGMEVHVGEWWVTHDDYLWEAIKDGVPSSSTDREYWDVVGL